jgi:hypothetical protein
MTVATHVVTSSGTKCRCDRCGFLPVAIVNMPVDTTKARPGNRRVPRRRRVMSWDWANARAHYRGESGTRQPMNEPFWTPKVSVDTARLSLGDMIGLLEMLTSCVSNRPPMLNGLTGETEVIGTMAAQE